MKVLVIISVLFCVALSAMAAVVPVKEEENATVLEAEVQLEAAVGPEMQLEAAVGPEMQLEVAVGPEDRFAFCPYGWFRHQSRCFLLVNTPMNWHSAEDHCNQLDATLASVQNPQEYRFLQQMVTTAGQTTAWLGGFYLQTRWRWIDRQGMYYTNWYSLGTAATYPCIYMRSTLGWSNSACNTSLRFICVRNPNDCY